jgi:hypothetical protein
MGWLELSKSVGGFIELLADVVTILASGIAIYIFLSKGKAIASVFSLLLNYSYQLSLSELKEKLERLNDYNANNEDHYDSIINILHEFVGQVRGNDKLSVVMVEQIKKIEGALARSEAGRKITEPGKRAMVSEVREKIRTLNVQNIDQLVGVRNE